MLSKVKWPVEVDHGFKRNKGFLRLEEDSGKGQAAVRIAQSSGVAQFGAEIAWKKRKVDQRRSLGFASRRYGRHLSRPRLWSELWLGLWQQGG